VKPAQSTVLLIGMLLTVGGVALVVRSSAR